MKNFIFSVAMVITALFITIKTSAQANTSLSNLASLTKANTSVSPGTNGSFDLGSSSFTWHNIYLSGYLYLDGRTFLTNPGTENNFVGASAGKSLTSGQNNFGAGFAALYSNTTGSSNTAAGTEALYTNTTGSYNTALGDIALYHNVSGTYNTATGMQTLYNNTTGSYNSANGFFALGYNSSGSYNAANGYFSLLSNTVGNYNVANGAYALYANTSGSYNTADGFDALMHNTTANGNTANGYLALNLNTTGGYNTATGMLALNNNSTGNYNTGFGFSTLKSTTTSYYNTAVGYNAGTAYNNGYNNVFLGANTDVNGTGYYNVIAIGQGTICTGNSQVTIGNGATGSYRAYANWTNISDARVKRNIKQNVPGLSFINKLQPITYNLDLDAADRIVQAPARKDSSGKIIEKSAVEISARKAKEQVIYTGFVAQDVEKAAKSMSYDFSGVDAAKNDKDLYGLRYAEFVVPLVKAVQELSKMNDEKDAKIDDLQKQINDLKLMIVSGKPVLTNDGDQGASLSQNTPNPFNNATSIHYSLPQTYASAQIIVTDIKGAVLKQYSLNTSSGSVQIDASTLASGAYSYSLYVNGKRIDSKQMISAK